MFLERLRLFNVRCYDEIEIYPHSKFNVVAGLNGQGKTSILEAIGLLTSLKSFRGAKNKEIIRFGQQRGLISGKVIQGDLDYSLDVKLGLSRKQGMLNGKFCKYLSEYIGKVSAVSFSPTDLAIIRGAPEFRRSWLDKVTSIFTPSHVDLIARYYKVLEQRNTILRRYAENRISKVSEDFEEWTSQLSRLGAEVIHNRLNTVDKIADIVSHHLEKITRDFQPVTIQYISKILSQDSYGQDHSGAIELVSQALTENLEKTHSKELILGTTLVGPHRDDLEIFLKEKSLKSYGSQGEVRSLVLAMRMTEVELWNKQHRLNPLLLIDDFSSELDEKRRQFLLNFLIESNSQVFLSTTEKINMGSVFEVSGGKVHLNSDGYVEN